MASTVHIPDGSTAVKVSIIDNTRMQLPCSHLLTPSIPQHQYLNAPSFSFLIEHPGSHRRFLFDLGLRKDFSSHPPAVQSFLSDYGWDTQITNDIPDILEKGGVPLQTIEAIIFSHHHFDHIGNLSQFPKDTSVIVGPGFKDAHLPGWPINPDSSLIDGEWQDRKIHEISFDEGDSGLSIGGFPAVDYFGDGSFFLLNAPGHTVGHLAALARVTTTPKASGKDAGSSFILMGGDICHYPGVFRPTKELPLDTEVQGTLHACPASFLLDIHPEKSCERPYYQMPSHATVDEKSAHRSIENLCAFDTKADVLVIIAHDASLIEILDFFPKSINDWKYLHENNYQWRFLGDFCSESCHV